MNNIITNLHKGALSPKPAIKWLAHSTHGAQLAFFGVVRKHNNSKKNVTAITFDIHKKLAERTLQKIAAEAIAVSGENTTRIYISHAYGKVNVGETCITIAVTSNHREAAYAANRYIIEATKKQMPIWKQEHYADGTTDWLDGHVLAS